MTFDEVKKNISRPGGTVVKSTAEKVYLFMSNRINDLQNNLITANHKINKLNKEIKELNGEINNVYNRLQEAHSERDTFKEDNEKWAKIYDELLYKHVKLLAVYEPEKLDY